MHSINLQGKTTLITGAARGIGRATALLFAKAGSNVVVNFHRDRAAADETCHAVRECGVRAVPWQADVADRRQVEAMVERSAKELGDINILVNNAAVWEDNPLSEFSTERLQRAVNINLFGCVHTARAVVPRMRAGGGGVIVNVSSTAGQRGEAGYSPYAATKSGVIGLTKSWAVELAPAHIRVNCVAPGWVETDMSRTALEGNGLAKVRHQIPLNRVGRPEEIAGPILFLASDMATFVTGEILNVNGGAVLCG